MVMKWERIMKRLSTFHGFLDSGNHREVGSAGHHNGGLPDQASEATGHNVMLKQMRRIPVFSLKPQRVLRRNGFCLLTGK